MPELLWTGQHSDDRRSSRIRRALLLSSSTSVAWALPFLLWRAGFATDVIATSSYLKSSRFVHRVDEVRQLSELAQMAQARVLSQHYDWVIATDDNVLRALVSIAWPENARPAHLPIWNPTYRSHLCSKIGLSRVLSDTGIKTPAFAVAHDCGEAILQAAILGYPVFLKIDFSGGGYGVFECRNDAELSSHRHLFGTGPILVQKKIIGLERDLSALYFEGVLVHFTYSTIERTMTRFGPSSLRTYHPLQNVPAAIFSELMAIGRVLSASGFVTISCIDAADGSGRYYFEADMRPNVWVDLPNFGNEDPAKRIRGWFLDRTGLIRPKSGPVQDKPQRVAYFLRLRLWELIVNRYGVWRFIHRADSTLVLRLLITKAIGDVLSLGKSLVPSASRSRLKAELITAGILIE